MADNTIPYVVTLGFGDFALTNDIKMLPGLGFLASDESGLPGGDPGSPGGTDWFTTEIGRWIRGLSTQFDGNRTLVRWRDEAEAAAIAGAPYPWFTSELQRRFLDYFISIQ